MSKIHLNDPVYLDLSKRTFRLEVMRGGMNRLLFRSNIRQDVTSRMEIFFMYVQYMSVPMVLVGPIIEAVGTLSENPDRVPWELEVDVDLTIFSVRSRGGEGLIVASAMALDESDASGNEPSSFPMMT